MRRHFLTHPSFQFLFTRSFAWGTFIVFFVLVGSASASLYLLTKDPTISAEQKQLLINGMSHFLQVSSLLLVITILIFLLVGFYLSYKFVGPLNRVELWLEEKINTFNTDPIKIRPGDEMEPLVNLLHDIFMTIRQK